MVYVGSSSQDADVEDVDSKRKGELTNSRSEKGLIWANIVVALAVHLFQAVFLALRANEHAVQLYVYYSGWRPADPNYGCFETLPSGEKNVCTVIQTRTESTKISMKALTVGFFLLSFAFQFLPMVLPGGRTAYLKFVRNGVQAFRYVEYSISASLMVMQFGVLVGVDDVNVILQLFWASAATMILGLCADAIDYYQRKADIVRSSFAATFIRVVPAYTAWNVFVFQWIFVGGRFVYSISAGTTAPKELYAIVILEFLAFLSFGINAALASANVIGRVTSEWVYIALSAVAKTILAEILFLSYAMRNTDYLKYGPMCPAS